MTVLCDYLISVRPALWIQFESTNDAAAMTTTSKPTAKPTSKPTPKPTPKPTATMKTTRQVRINEGNKPNVRSKPSTDGKIVGQAKSKQTYELLDTSGTWYKIRLEDGTEGWIASGMATIIGATSKPSAKATPKSTVAPGRVSKVRIKEEYNPNVKAMPSTYGEAVGRAKAGQEYEVLDTSRSWYKIRLEDGTEGWLYDGLATVVGTSNATIKPTAKATRKPTAKPTRKPTARITPKPTAKPAEKPSDSKSGTTTRKIDDWYISDDGKYGIQIFGLDKNYDGSYYVTIYIMQMSSRQIIASSDITVMDKSEVDEWMALAEKYSDDFQFHLSDSHAIQEFCYQSYKYYSFNIVVDIVRNGRFDNPIMFQNGISFRIP